MRAPSLVLGLCVAVGALEIDPLKHHVTPLVGSKFDSVISKHRAWQVAAVFFYRKSSSDKATKSGFAVFDEAAKDLKGMFRFAAIDCDADRKFCEESNVVQGALPAVLVYPRHPMPAFPVTKLEKAGDLVKILNKQLPTEHIKTVTSANIDEFLGTSGGNYLPKVLLFSSKQAPPPLFKALSNEFRNEMQFGFVNFEAESTLTSRFKVGKSGTLVMQETRQNKPVITQYKGELNYPDIQTWVNLRRETFVKGGGFSEAGTGGDEEKPKKPWREEVVPELTKESASEVCFKQENLCLIYLREGSIEEAEIKTLTAVKEKFGNELPNLNLSYLDLGQEPAFKKLFFDGGERVLPSAVLFNPHKRLRFSLIAEGTKADATGLKSLLERALSGDVRYKNVKELPAFSKRKSAAKGEEL